MGKTLSIIVCALIIFSIDCRLHPSLEKMRSHLRIRKTPLLSPDQIERINQPTFPSNLKPDARGSPSRRILARSPWRPLEDHEKCKYGKKAAFPNPETQQMKVITGYIIGSPWFYRNDGFTKCLVVKENPYQHKFVVNKSKIQVLQNYQDPVKKATVFPVPTKNRTTSLSTVTVTECMPGLKVSDLIDEIGWIAQSQPDQSPETCMITDRKGSENDQYEFPKRALFIDQLAKNNWDSLGARSCKYGKIARFIDPETDRQVEGFIVGMPDRRRDLRNKKCIVVKENRYKESFLVLKSQIQVKWNYDDSKITQNLTESTADANIKFEKVTVCEPHQRVIDLNGGIGWIMYSTTDDNACFIIDRKNWLSKQRIQYSFPKDQLFVTLPN